MLIELEKVEFFYPPGGDGERKGIRDITMKIEDGDTLGIIGSIGSGKTTLAQIISGLITPSSGSVYIDRKRLYHFKQMGGRVGFLFQSPEESFFAQNVFDEVIYGFKNYIKEKVPEKEINKVFNMVGLDFECYKKRNTYHLSLGEKRRVALASMLIFNPELLILDEFTLSLDGEGLKLFKGIVSKLKKKKNIIVLISHDLDELFPLVNKIILINEGKILFNGVLKELFENVDLLYKSGLKPPQSVEMSGLLSKKGHLLPLDILDEKKAASEIAKRCF